MENNPIDRPSVSGGTLATYFGNSGTGGTGGFGAVGQASIFTVIDGVAFTPAEYALWRKLEKIEKLLAALSAPA